MRTTTWENLGTDAVTNDFNTLMKDADLDYNVVLKDLYFEESGNKILVPNRKVTVREDTNQVFGVVSDRYQVCQNKEAFDFVQYIDDVELVKAGGYNGLVYLIAKLPETNVLGDVIRPNLIFQNTHDGSGSITSTICMLRMVCQNQFISSFADSPATMRISHLGDVDEKLLVAKETLSKVYEHVRTFEAEASDLAVQKVTPRVLNQIIEKFFVINEDYSDRYNARVEEDRETFLKAYKADDNGNFKGTKWGIINAYSDFMTHSEPMRKTSSWAENRFLYSLNPTTMTNFVNYVKAA